MLTGDAKLLVVLSVRLARFCVPPELIARLSTELLVALMFTVASDEVRPTWATAGLVPRSTAAAVPQSIPFLERFIADSAAKGLASPAGIVRLRHSAVPRGRNKERAIYHTFCRNV